MTSRQRHGRALWLGLTLQLLVGGHAAGDLSLCIAEDGHRALELSHAEQPCRREVERHHPAEDVHLSHEMEHHPCRDVLLVRDLPTHPTTPGSVGEPLIVAVPAVAGASPAARVERRAAWPPSPRPPGLAAQRTVVIQA